MPSRCCAFLLLFLAATLLLAHASPVDDVVRRFRPSLLIMSHACWLYNQTCFAFLLIEIMQAAKS